MGASWAWPCTDRDRRHLQGGMLGGVKRKPDKFIEDLNSTDSNFLVAFTKSQRLDAFLRSNPEPDYSPVAVAQHPSQPFHALVVFQKTASITVFKSLTGNFRSFNSAITGKFPEDWRSNLEHDLNQLYELHSMEFIGSAIDESGGYNFAFCQHDLAEDHSTSFYVTSISQPVDSDHLQNCLNEQQNLRQGVFRAAVFHEGDVLLVFENYRRGPKRNYVVTELPYVGAENFEQEFVNKIELCTVDQRLEFAGLASSSAAQQLFIVLAISLS